jgi:hypothetical protein
LSLGLLELAFAAVSAEIAEFAAYWRIRLETAVVVELAFVGFELAESAFVGLGFVG